MKNFFEGFYAKSQGGATPVHGRPFSKTYAISGFKKNEVFILG
jgi:hypothetical protein